MSVSGTVAAADAIVSYYPEFAGFGEFNNIGTGTCLTLSLLLGHLEAGVSSFGCLCLALIDKWMQV